MANTTSCVDPVADEVDEGPASFVRRSGWNDGEDEDEEPSQT